MCVVKTHRGSRVLIVVVALRIQREQSENLKVIVQSADSRTGSFSRVIPSLERDNEDSTAKKLFLSHLSRSHRLLFGSASTTATGGAQR
jgi:hypothetical protein